MKHILATIEIQFNGTQADLDDFCAQHKYQDTVTDENGDEVANPESKVDFFKRITKEFVYGSVKAQRVRSAEKSAGDTERAKEVSF